MGKIFLCLFGCKMKPVFLNHTQLQVLSFLFFLTTGEFLFLFLNLFIILFIFVCLFLDCLFQRFFHFYIISKKQDNFFFFIIYYFLSRTKEPNFKRCLFFFISFSSWKCFFFLSKYTLQNN